MFHRDATLQNQKTPNSHGRRHQMAENMIVPPQEFVRDTDLGSFFISLHWWPRDLLLGFSYHNIGVISRIAHEHLNFRRFHVTRCLGFTVQNEFQSDGTTLIHVAAKNDLSTPNKLANKFSKDRKCSGTIQSKCQELTPHFWSGARASSRQLWRPVDGWSRKRGNRGGWGMFVQYKRRRLLAVISWESNSRGGNFRCLVISSRSTQDIDATFSTRNLQRCMGL